MTRLKVVAVVLCVFAAGAGLFAQQEGGTARKPGGADQSKPQGPSPVDPATRALIEARIATASEIYNGEMTRHEQTNGLPPDDTPMWSLRWMEDQIRLNAGPAETLAAIQAHLERVKRLEGLLDGYARTGQGRFTSPLRAKYFRLEAEQMLAEARTAHPQLSLPTPKTAIERRVTTPPPPQPK
jgi:hypothetical protein